jgi:hypothetical protein
MRANPSEVPNTVGKPAVSFFKLDQRDHVFQRQAHWLILPKHKYGVDKVFLTSLTQAADGNTMTVVSATPGNDGEGRKTIISPQSNLP